VRCPVFSGYSNELVVNVSKPPFRAVYCVQFLNSDVAFQKGFGMRDSVSDRSGDFELLPPLVIVSDDNGLAESVSGCSVDCTNLPAQGKVLVSLPNCAIVLNNVNSFGQSLRHTGTQFNRSVQ
jgi:hypothetical protein